MDVTTQSISSMSGPGLWLVDPTSTTAGSILDFGGTLGGVAFSLSAQAASNNPGSATLAYVEANYNSVTNNSGATRRFVLETVATDYTMPYSPPDLNFQNSTSGTLTAGSIKGTFDSTAAGISGPSIAFGPVSAPGSIAMTPSPDLITIPVALVPYTMTATFDATITNGTVLATGGGTATLVPVPEPGTLALTLSTLPLAGIALYRRRRQRV